MTLAEKIQAACIGQKKKLAIAESCTGGAIASLLTAIPNASHYFLGSIVAYAPKWKEEFLQVKPQTLKQFGAESEPTVIEMVAGLFAKTEADLAIAVSGFAGPSGKAPGTIFIAIGERGKETETIEIQVEGTRAEVIQAAAEEALSALLRWIEEAP